MPAPDFTLTDQNGEDWTLSDHLDAAVVLLFLRWSAWRDVMQKSSKPAPGSSPSASTLQCSMLLSSNR